LILNNQYAPTPSRYMTNGKPMQVEKVNDTTVRITFQDPYGDFLAELASPLGQHPVLYAKHYCSQFHPKYNPKIDEAIKAAGATDWKNLLQQKCGDIEIPARWGIPRSRRSIRGS
jgi:peptide/nickel transport system substrate-binding protein